MNDLTDKAFIKEYHYKQVIVMRNDLNMRKGKMIAQGAHASLAAMLNDMESPEVKGWLAGPFAKVCVQVSSEEELLDVYYFAREAGLLCSLITDSGRTEFNGVPTRTCIAVGPGLIEDVDKVTGKLKLL
jgi:PTH2 family peptidyl-tRNA hydrolase